MFSLASGTASLSRMSSEEASWRRELYLGSCACPCSLLQGSQLVQAPPTSWGEGYFLGLSPCSSGSFPSVWILQGSVVNRTQQAELTPTCTKQICSRVPLMRYLPVNRFPQYSRGQVSRKLLGTKFKIILPTQHPGNFSAIQWGPAAPSPSRSGSVP